MNANGATGGAAGVWGGGLQASCCLPASRPTCPSGWPLTYQPARASCKTQHARPPPWYVYCTSISASLPKERDGHTHACTRTHAFAANISSYYTDRQTGHPCTVGRSNRLPYPRSFPNECPPSLSTACLRRRRLVE